MQISKPEFPSEFNGFLIDENDEEEEEEATIKSRHWDPWIVDNNDNDSDNSRKNSSNDNDSDNSRKNSSK